MQIDNIILSNFRCFSEQPVSVRLEPDLTCFVGNNGSGKTTFLLALKRLFGTSADERKIIREDFYLESDEDYKSIDERELYIEVIFSFPELGGDIRDAQETCPAFSSVIYADDKGELKARMRLEAIWDESGYEDDVQSRLYWIKTYDEVAFGDGIDFKVPVSAHDRKNIRLRYIPAFRDSSSTLRNEVKSLSKILEDYTDISPATKKSIEDVSSSLSSEIQNLASIKTATEILKNLWEKTHDGTLLHYQEPILEATPTEIGALLRSLSIKLSPSESGDARDISELSDGQVSLLYFTLSLALYELEQKHYAGKAKGFKSLDKDIAVFTIFAFEEPENHLSPYYLGRILKVLHQKSKSAKATALITSHSASVVRRLERVEQIRHFRQELYESSRYTLVKKVLLPKKKSEEDYKYISQAVIAHPELYFSKLVILGEGDSEEIVIPKIAQQLDFDLDPSFVAFVKLGGRHINHMWRLLTNLKIPYVTLLDLDLGRYEAGVKRIKYVISQLAVQGIKFAYPSGVDPKDLDNELLEREKLKIFLNELEKFNIFFSTPLDLDMALIRAFPSLYNADGAHKSKRDVLEKAIFGENGNSGVYDHLKIKLSDEDLIKYRYLFSTKSKVSSHYSAISNLDNVEDFEKHCPQFIKKLIARSSDLVQGSVVDE